MPCGEQVAGARHIGLGPHQIGARGGQFRRGCIKLEPGISIVQTGEQLASGNPVSHIDQTDDQLARHAKSQRNLMLGANGSGVAV